MWLRKLFNFLVWLLRIASAVLIGLGIERYWFTKEHLCGYLWLLNQFRVKGNEADKTFTEAMVRYSLEKRILFNTLIALFYWLLMHKKVIEIDGISQLFNRSVLLSTLFYLTQYPISIMTNLIWQAHLHNCVHTTFLLFGMGIPLTIKPGRLIERKKDKSD